MKIILTGAHFTTAVATLEELKKYPKVAVVYIGRKTTMEGDPTPSVESIEFPKLGVKFISLTAGRLQKAFTSYTIPSLLRIPIGLIQAFYILMREKPDVVLSFGGYVTVPVVVNAWLMSIPVIIHEQTLVAGLANKVSSWFADKVAVSFATDYAFDKKKVILTGNPIRQDILEYSRGVYSTHPKGVLSRHLRIFKVARREKLPVIFITGGNQGSHIINLAVEGCLEKLIQIACVIHQTGSSKFKDFEKLKHKQNEHYLIAKFISQGMGYILSHVDLVVCRAGINTLIELAYLGTPALVIPVPYLYQDEQNKNALFFEKLGLVKTLSQEELSSKSLLVNIKNCLNNLQSLKRGAKKAKKVIIPNGAKRLALETILLAKKQSYK